jgi:hypothetical protein
MPRQNEYRNRNIKIGGRAPSMKAATRLASEVRQKIALGVFDYSANFPNSTRVKAAAPQAVTLGDDAPIWLGTLAEAKSTKKRPPFNNFWVSKLGKKALVDIRHNFATNAPMAASIRTATRVNSGTPPRRYSSNAMRNGYRGPMMDGPLRRSMPPSVLRATSPFGNWPKIGLRTRRIEQSQLLTGRSGGI